MEKKMNLQEQRSVKNPLETVSALALTVKCQQVDLKSVDPPASIMTPIMRLRAILSLEDT